MADTRLSVELKAILERLSGKQLDFLASIAQMKTFPEFATIVNLLIDNEKNKFFGENEYDEKRLALDHTYSRGMIGGLIQFGKLIAASQHELEKRGEKL